MIIAIDGPAGAGKSTVARLVAHALGLPFLDTGAMYRAVTLEVLRRGRNPADERDCAEVAGSLELDFDAQGRIAIDGRPGEPDVRSDAVTRSVSAVSAHRTVRALIVARQRELARAWGGLVAEGRDTASVVFPEADHVFFLTASTRTRAARRAHELGRPQDAAAIERELERRDGLDSTRVHSPLRRIARAELIDTDGLDPQVVCTRILERVRGPAAAPP